MTSEAPKSKPVAYVPLLDWRGDAIDQVAIIDAEDEELVTAWGPWHYGHWRQWREETDELKPRDRLYVYCGNPRRHDKDPVLFLTELVMGLDGRWAASPINGDPLDCRKSNLEVWKMPP